MRNASALVAAFVTTAACSSPAPAPVPAPADPPAPVVVPAPEPPAPAPTYAAPPPTALTAQGDAGGLAAWTASKKAFFAQPLDAKGAPIAEPREVPLTSAHRLHAVYAVGGGFAVAAHDLCPDRKYFFKCLFLRAISAKGEPVGDELIVKTREWIREERVARLGGVTGVLTSHMYIPPAFARLTLAPDGALVVDRRDLKVEEEVVDAVRLTAAEGRFVAILRSESEDPARSIRLEIDAEGKVKGP